MREDLEALRGATVAAVLRGPGELPSTLREALARGEAPDEMRVLVEKVRDRPWEVTDADLDALRASYTDDQLFEVVMATVIGAAEVRFRAGIRALEGQ